MHEPFYVLSEDEGYEPLGYIRTLEEFPEWAKEYARLDGFVVEIKTIKTTAGLLTYVEFRFPEAEEAHLVVYANKTYFYKEGTV